MNLPQPGDYIDIHVHDGKPASGVFIIESLMAHEEKLPENVSGVAYTFGIHPWFLNENNHKQLISSVENSVIYTNIIGIGEAGFDKLRGPSPELQRKAFEEQVVIAGAYMKPVIIHCVRAWDELLTVRKKLKPKTPWMIHGFRGNVELATQLLSKGMYLSFWFDFVLRPESADLLKSLPTDRIFLETDGAEVDIRDIYMKVAKDIGISVDKLKTIISENFKTFFNFNSFLTIV
jgi:TatD DNase family protein